MKEIRIEKAKKFVLIFTILVSIFLITTLVGYLVEIKFFGDSNYTYVDYLLYLLGYGSLDNLNIWFRLFFSIGSLLSLTLFSSACTVTWLESRRILNLDNKILITKSEDGEFVGKIRLSSKHRDIYGAKVTLVVNISGKSFSETTEIAYIPKNQTAYALFPVELNSVIYKHFNEYKADSKVASDLVATVTYSDMLSGTEFTVFEKFSCKTDEDFAFDNGEAGEENNKRDFMRFVSQRKFDIDFSEAQILDSRSPKRYSYSKIGKFEVKFSSDIEYNEGDFQMLYLPVPEVTMWGVYHDMRCLLSIKASIPDGTLMRVEIKRCDGSIINTGDDSVLTKDKGSLMINLSNYKRSTWENIKELCFTVFYGELSSADKTSTITVEECAFILPKAVK